MPLIYLIQFIVRLQIYERIDELTLSSIVYPCGILLVLYSKETTKSAICVGKQFNVLPEIFNIFIHFQFKLIIGIFGFLLIQIMYNCLLGNCVELSVRS